jgi:hypothetical protein
LVSHLAVMMRRMMTTDVNDLVSGRYEPCVHFEGSDVCERCGWLESEHEPRLAITPSAASRVSQPSPSSSQAA